MPEPSHEFQRIAPLPADEVARICAGEVVERPLSVVKELIENSLDAGATQVVIELTDGGKQQLRVSDNGQGIPFDDLPLAVMPHHTSKIRCLDDIYALSTLGFRGEALHSIAAVSRLTLTSRTAGAGLGGRIALSGGALIEHVRANLQPGTEVEMRDLFFNTPARLKFLKSRQSEAGQISALLASYALAYPAVRWRLLSQGRLLLATDGGDDLLAVLADLLGSGAEQLATIDFEFPPSAVSGYISTPQHHRHNRQRQWFFINRRPVSNKLLYKAIDDAVREFMSPGKFPMGAFFLDLPPEEIDVNVHPMKREVSFAQPQAVYSLLRTAVQRALGREAGDRQRRYTQGLAAIVKPDGKAAHSPAADPGADPDAPAGYRSLPLYEEGQSITPATAIDFPAQPRANAVSPPERTAAGARDVSFKPRNSDRESQSHPRPISADEQAVPGLVSQVADSFLVAVTATAVYLIDQHAAHERILFEELYERMQGPDAHAYRQRLLFPLLVQLTPAEAAVAADYIPALGAMGFACELGAGPNLVVQDVPLALAGRITPELVHGVFSELAGQEQSTVLAEQVKALAASLACRAAIKAGDRLPPDERYTLVQQLLLAGIAA